MRKRVRITLGILLVAIAGAILWQVPGEREPVYQGKPVTFWIKEGYFHFPSGVTPQQANEAVLAVGTNGLPYYVRLLETKEDWALKLKIIRWLKRQPYLRGYFTGPDAASHRAVGACGLSILGAEAKPAIPALSKLLACGDEEQIGRAALTLPDIGLEGIQPLTNILMNSKTQSRFFIVNALGAYAKPENRWSKPRASEEREVATKIVVPILISCLNDADIKVQGSAISSLGRFAAEPEAVVPVIAERLQNTTNDMRVRVLALGAIDDYGLKAQPAVPALVQCLQDQNKPIRSQAARVLKKIDPEAAAKAGVK
jgi:HEAT repeat protein